MPLVLLRNGLALLDRWSAAQLCLKPIHRDSWKLRGKRNRGPIPTTERHAFDNERFLYMPGTYILLRCGWCSPVEYNRDFLVSWTSRFQNIRRSIYLRCRYIRELNYNRYLANENSGYVVVVMRDSEKRKATFWSFEYQLLMEHFSMAFVFAD